jgi:tight adherence protein B
MMTPKARKISHAVRGQRIMDGWLGALLTWFNPSEGEVPKLVPVAVFLCVLLLIEALYLFLHYGRGKGEKRIKERLKFVQGLEGGPSTESLLKSQILTEDSWKKSLLAALSRVFNLDELLLQADVPWRAGTFLSICLMIGSAAGTYGFLQFGILGGFAGFLGVGYLVPNMFLILKKKRRLKKFEKQLPEALGLMGRSLKAGHSFPSSLQLVADEMANPIGLEFFKTFKEFNYGLDLSDALMNLYKRNQLRDLKFFITAVVIQRETGGNLVEILEKIAHLIRERFKLINQIKALTAEGRLSGLILTLLPVGVTLLMWRSNAKYISLLWTHPTGWMMAVVALLFQFLGIISIIKIVNIKV